MITRCCLVAIVVGLTSLGSGCAEELDTPGLVRALKASGLRIKDGQKVRSQMQREFDNLGDAMASGVPMPKLARTLIINGVRTDIYWCPGKSKQAQTVSEVLLRGPRPTDPEHLAIASEMLTGYVNVPFEAHIISMAPEPSQDGAVLKIAATLAKLEDR